MQLFRLLPAETLVFPALAVGMRADPTALQFLMVLQRLDVRPSAKPWHMKFHMRSMTAIVAPTNAHIQPIVTNRHAVRFEQTPGLERAAWVALCDELPNRTACAFDAIQDGVPTHGVTNAAMHGSILTMRLPIAIRVFIILARMNLFVGISFEPCQDERLSDRFFSAHALDRRCIFAFNSDRVY